MNKYVVDKEKRMQLGSYIKEKRNERRVGVNQLSAKVDVTNSLISKLENGLIQKISPILLKEVANGLNIDYIELYRIAGYLDDEDLKPDGTLDFIPLQNDIKIPVYESVSAGLGYSANATVVEEVFIDNSLGKNSIGALVQGDSMKTTITDGAVIIINPDLVVENNDIGVFIHEGESLVKRLKVLDGKIYLSSDNSEYPAREVRVGDEYKVCGKVVEVRNRKF